MPKTLNLEHPPFLLSVTSLLLSYNRFLNAFYNVVDVIIRDIRTCWQTEANLEDFFFNAICINRSTLIHRLLVHRLPNRTALDLLGKHEHAQSLHILIRLAIRRRAIHRMNHTCSTANSRLEDLLVILLQLLQLSLQPTSTKVLINANADRLPPRYLSMKMYVKVSETTVRGSPDAYPPKIQPRLF